MKVGIVAYTFYELDHRVRRYAEALAERGDEVDAIALRKKGQPAKEVLNGVNLYRIQERPYDERSVFDYIFRIGRFFLKGSRLILRKQIRTKYTILHLNNVPDFLVFMAFIPKILGTRVILDIHDILPEFFAQKFNKGLNTFLVKALFLLEKISVRFASHTIVANDLWREKIVRRVKISADKCSTLMNYPDLNLFRPIPFTTNHEQFIIVYAGTISHLHGLDIAISALAIVKKQIPGVQFLIYTGTNNEGYFRFLTRLITELHLEENVKIYDSLPVEALMKVYSTASIGVVPKRGGVFADEAFSTKIFDFLAVGLPVIASRTKIDEYYFDDSVIMFFAPENHEDLAKCIMELYGNVGKRRSLIEHGRQYIASNNWNVKKKDYLKLVDSIATGNKRA